MTAPSTRLRHDETGIALVSALLVLLLMSSLMVGFMAMAMADTRTRAISGARTQAFYAAHAGLEQLTADLGDLFQANFAAGCSEIDALVANPPDLPGVTWVQPDGGSGYRIGYTCDDDAPVAAPLDISSGPFQGFKGLATNFDMEVTAHQLDGSEASLTRSLQTVAIPVFQFGMFSETDLSFFAGPAFNFGGRVHTNGNLFLAADPGPLTLSDRVTAVGEVIRAEMSNELSTSSSHSGTVRVLTSSNSFRDLDRDEGSLVGGLGSNENEPTWTDLSTGTYNFNIRNGRTGAKRLDLPLTSFGASPIDLIRRPVVDEDDSNPNVLSQRFFTMASLRILLSDTAAEITGLPTVTADAPVSLGTFAPAGYTISTATPAFAVSASGGTSTSTNGIRTAAGTPLLGGFIKIEMQNDAGTWTDVTLEILNLGIAGRPWPALDSDGDVTGTVCGSDPSPNAIIRIQRRVDGTSCSSTSTAGNTYWPNVLYDPREALMRDGHPDDSPPKYGGAMHYIELDANNLRRWFEGTIGTSGDDAIDVTGYVVYFSDRRGNKSATVAGVETGEYGFEDVVNRATGGTWTGGTPNASLEEGEDLNGDGALQTYGRDKILPVTMLGTYTTTIFPWTDVDFDGGSNDGDIDPGDRLMLRVNPPVFFRRALKLVNGGLGNIVSPGLTVASENPVYVQGNWNANSSGFGNPHVATSILADAVTLLSNNFSDRRSFEFAHDVDHRNATTTWYRTAIIAGKGLSFERISGTTNDDYGTDGGAHNFLRYIEDWGGQTLNYRGAIASMYISRQAVGTYKCCADVYSAPTRAFAFDTDFLTPALLPPRTPMFRDVNTTGFAQIIRPR
jgi:hypothetical protein